MHEIECEICGRWFEATRPDARLCSTRCRVRKHRLLRAGKLLPGEVIIEPTPAEAEQLARMAAWLETTAS